MNRTTTGTAIISAQVPAAMRAKLQRLAGVSALVRRAVAEHLARESSNDRRAT